MRGPKPCSGPGLFPGKVSGVGHAAGPGAGPGPGLRAGRFPKYSCSRNSRISEPFWSVALTVYPSVL